MHGARRIGYLASTCWLLGGCAPTPVAPSKAASPAMPVADLGARSDVPDGTISAREAAVILRRTALMRAMQRSEDDSWTAAMELSAVLSAARSAPERDALVDLVDRRLAARAKPDSDSRTTDLRLEIVRAWLDRGDRARASAQAKLVHDNERMVRPEERAELYAAVGHPTLEATIAELVAPEIGARIRAQVAARWGDAAAAEAAVADLDPEDRCPVAIALAERRRREGVGATRWLVVAEEALDAIDEEAGDAIVRCMAELGRELAAAGDTKRAASVLGKIDGHPIQHVCELLYATAERVDATLLDGPLLAGARSADVARVTWSGCGSLLGEVAARRGDRRLAQRMSGLAQSEADGWDAERGFDRLWMTAVRLGRLDPLAPAELSGDGFRALAVAEIFDEQPGARVDLERLVSALTPEPEGPDAAEEPEEPDEDPGGDAP